MNIKEYNNCKRIPGWFGDNDIETLSRLSSNIVNGTIIELGSLHGRTSYCLAKSSPTSKIFCLDYWDGSMVASSDTFNRPYVIELFKMYTSECPNITPVQLSHTQKITPLWEEPVDMIFIDTSHENPNDWDIIKFWTPKIKKGGVLCGHDYYVENTPYPDVNQNIKNLEKILNQTVTTSSESSVWSFILDFEVVPQTFQAYEAQSRLLPL